MESAHGSDFEPFFVDWSQTEEPSEIEIPLRKMGKAFCVEKWRDLLTKTSLTSWDIEFCDQHLPPLPLPQLHLPILSPFQ